MFSNTTAIDIAIGLVFVYLIYSLLINIIAEMLSTWFGVRARLLRQGIDNLLNDKNPKQLGADFLSWLKDIFLVEPSDFKFSASGKFYKDENIRSLAKRGENSWYSFRNTKPSYISKELYAQTILNMLSRKGRGVNEWDRIVFSIETNALILERDTNRHMRNMLSASDGQMEIFRQLLQNGYSEMMDRVNGWYKRKIGLLIFWIGFLLCIAYNIDSIEIVKILSSNPALREEIVRRAHVAIQDNSAIARIIQSKADSIDAAQSVKALNLEIYHNLYTESLMAKGWDFVNREEIIYVDSECANLGREIAERQSNMVASTSENVKKQKATVDEKKNLASKRAADSPLMRNITIDKDLLLSIYAAKLDQINESANRLRRLIDSNITKKSNLTEIINEWKLLKDDSTQSIIDSLDSLLNMEVVSIKQFNRSEGMFQVTRKSTFWERVLYIIENIFPWKQKFWGLVVTSLALSLGANFWFDLLGRLISLRGAGVKPEEKSLSANFPSPSDKNTGLFVDKPDPVAKVISENWKYWESMPGVISINRGAPVGAKMHVVEIVVDEVSYIKGSIPDNVEVNVRGISQIISISKVNGERGVLLTDNSKFVEGNIYHPGTDQKGSPAGIVLNRRTNRHAVLTCSHVVQLNDEPFMQPFKDETELVVVQKQQLIKVSLGRVQNLNISSFMDAAIIDIENKEVKELIKSNSSMLPKISTPRQISEKDIGTHFTIHSPRDNKIIVPLNNPCVDYTFDLGTTSEARFRNLIRFGGYTSADDLPTEKGDSGSLITDKDGRSTAILLGHAFIFNKYFIFGIRMSDVFEIMQIESIA